MAGRCVGTNVAGRWNAPWLGSATVAAWSFATIAPIPFTKPFFLFHDHPTQGFEMSSRDSMTFLCRRAFATPQIGQNTASRNQVVAQTRSISPGRKPGKTNSRLPAGDFLADRRFLVFFTSRIDCAQ